MSSRPIWYRMCPDYPIFFVLLLLLPSTVYSSGSDCSADDVLIRDGGHSTVISSGKKFELGFFTPDGSFGKRRYLGIWYYQSNPKIVVWVANRNKSLSESNGCLTIRDGHAVVLDMEGTIYWSTNSTIHGRILRNLQNRSYTKYGLRNSSFIVKPRGKLQLDDIGDLIFDNGKGEWHSFDNPTDTFLPGMNLDGSLSLTSWNTPNNPAPGNFTLQLQPTLTISNGETDYWKSSGTDVIPQALSEVLLGSTSDNSTTRLVMNFTGQVQFWKREVNRSWSLIWSAPKDDKCSLYNVCGNFGICNSNNGQLCKCLPGYEPIKLDKWTSGEFSDGCSPKSESCKSSDDMFLRLPMMRMGAWSTYNEYAGGQDCKIKCQKECHCKAYSCGRTDCKETGIPTETGCWMWSSIDLTNLQEEYPEGFTIYVHTTRSDIASTPRDCEPCGTNVIPYPLSTAANCGDPSYFNFYCNTSTGQVGFSTSNGTFKVTAITPEAKNFTIRVEHDTNCDRKHLESLLLSPKHPLPFIVKNCRSQPLAEVEQSFIEVEMVWEPPSEPVCNASKDCHDWPHTTCKAAKGGKPRCICRPKFQWDVSMLQCVKVPFPRKVVVACASGALLVVLLCSIFFIRHVQKRGLAGRQGSVDFQGDDTGGIDVPIFDWESIIAATDNFADENKLGTGGFGAVYKGKLPDGKEIAVKRLSTVTGQGIEEFRTEVVLIAKLQHRNLVRLLGYCVKANERILLYEYMPNGSLDSYLFDQTRSVFLDWEKRFDIIVGIARGLLYLHQDSRLRIIHRDLKPSNILLDEEMNPKISDFGIARIVAGKETEGITKRVIGTYGYMSPEYAYEGLFSVKSDVFSFGVVVLETISGRRNSKIFQLEHGLNLQGYAWKLWTEDRGLDLMDQALEESCNPSEVLKCIHIGLLCVQEDPSDRPIMSAVVLMLRSENADLPPPKQPAFISKKEPSETSSSSSIMDSSFNDVMTFSTGAR